MIDAKVILDSVNEYGDRLTTVEATFHRFVLAEVNTHRAFSRNSASSRAIPVTKQLEKVKTNPAFPVVWTSEQAGMQGGEPLEGQALRDAQDLFELIHWRTTDAIQTYVDKHPLDAGPRLHKSLLNRLLEPFMWHTAIITATQDGWDNFFQQRSGYYTQLAQPEFMKVADAIYDAMQGSTPTLLQHGEWHTPYIRPEDDFSNLDISPLEARKRVSVARCARVSYLTHDGVRDILIDLDLFQKLTTAQPPHWSPLEHVATPAWRFEDTLGNFTGWHQMRHHG